MNAEEETFAELCQGVATEAPWGYRELQLRGQYNRPCVVVGAMCDRDASYTSWHILDVYVLDVEINPSACPVRKAYPWLYDEEVMSALWSSSTLKRCWVHYALDLREYMREDAESVWVITDLDAHPMGHVLRAFAEPPKWLRVWGDRMYTYGDGGRNLLMYPVWYTDRLDVKESVRRGLVSRLVQFSVERNDVQENGVVHDIVDPDLAPHRLSAANAYMTTIRAQMDAHEKRVSDMFGADVRAYASPFQPKSKDLESNVWAEEKMPKGVSLRHSYCWIPSLFTVGVNGDVNLKSPIHQIPAVRANRTLYSHICRVFAAMVPMFRRIGLCLPRQGGGGDDDVTHVQVVVKCQQYVIPPRSTYHGKWHVEGATESIAGVGVYYAAVDSDLQGGALKFRPKSVPGSAYNASPERSIALEGEVPVRQGTAVVFSNAVPHRFRRIANDTDAPVSRVFINFFIVSPDVTLTDTTVVPDVSTIQACLRAAVRRHLGPHAVLPRGVVDLIVSMLQLWLPREAKAFRSEARKHMRVTKSGWGYICWGNAGECRYVTTREELSDYHQREVGRIEHSESSDGVANHGADPGN